MPTELSQHIQQTPMVDTSFAQFAAPLALHTDRMVALLGAIAAVQDHDAVALTQRESRLPPVFGENFVVTPPAL